MSLSPLYSWSDELSNFGLGYRVRTGLVSQPVDRFLFLASFAQPRTFPSTASSEKARSLFNKLLLIDVR